MIRGLRHLEDRRLEYSAGWRGTALQIWGKDVPTQVFPNGNPVKACVSRNAKTLGGHHHRAIRNMLLLVTLIVTSLLTTRAMLRA